MTDVVQRSDANRGVELLVLSARRQTVGLLKVEGESLAVAKRVESLPFDFDGGAELELSVGINVHGEQVVGGLTDRDDKVEAFRGGVVGSQGELVGVTEGSGGTSSKERARSTIGESVGNVRDGRGDDGGLGGPDNGQEVSLLRGQESGLSGGVLSVLVDIQSTVEVNVEANDLAEVFRDDLGGNQSGVGVGIQRTGGLVTTADERGSDVVVTVQFASSVGDQNETDLLSARSVLSVGAVNVGQSVVSDQGRRNKETNDVGDLEGILQRGSVFEGTSSRDGIVGLERDRSQEVDAAEHIDFRSNSDSLGESDFNTDDGLSGTDDGSTTESEVVVLRDSQDGAHVAVSGIFSASPTAEGSRGHGHHNGEGVVALSDALDPQVAGVRAASITVLEGDSGIHTVSDERRADHESDFTILSTRGLFVEDGNVAGLKILRSRVEGALSVHQGTVGETIRAEVARVATAEAINTLASDCCAVTVETSLREDCAHTKSGEKKTDPGFVHERLMRASVECCEIVVVGCSLMFFVLSNLAVVYFLILVLRVLDVLSLILVRVSYETLRIELFG